MCMCVHTCQVGIQPGGSPRLSNSRGTWQWKGDETLQVEGLTIKYKIKAERLNVGEILRKMQQMQTLRHQSYFLLGVHDGLHGVV